MKICIITNSFSHDLIGGTNTYVQNITSELIKIGNQLIVISGMGKKDYSENKEGAKIYRFHPFNVSTLPQVDRQSKLKQRLWTLLDIYSTSYKLTKDEVVSPA